MNGVAAPIAALTNGREERDGPRGIGTTTLTTGRCRVSLTHRAELFKGCVTIAAVILVQRHVLDSLSENLWQNVPQIGGLRSVSPGRTVVKELVTLPTGIPQNAFTLRWVLSRVVV